MNKRRAAVIASIILAIALLLYLGGLLGQFLTNYEAWLAADGLNGEAVMGSLYWNPLRVYPAAFTWNGLKGMQAHNKNTPQIAKVPPMERPVPSTITGTIRIHPTTSEKKAAKKFARALKTFDRPKELAMAISRREFRMIRKMANTINILLIVHNDTYADELVLGIWVWFEE